MKYQRLEYPLHPCSNAGEAILYNRGTYDLRMVWSQEAKKYVSPYAHHLPLPLPRLAIEPVTTRAAPSATQATPPTDTCEWDSSWQNPYNTTSTNRPAYRHSSPDMGDVPRDFRYRKHPSTRHTSPSRHHHSWTPRESRRPRSEVNYRKKQARPRSGGAGQQGNYPRRDQPSQHEGRRNRSPSTHPAEASAPMQRQEQEASHQQLGSYESRPCDLLLSSSDQPDSPRPFLPSQPSSPQHYTFSLPNRPQYTVEFPTESPQTRGKPRQKRALPTGSPDRQT